MEKFYKDERDPVQVNAEYIGKSMAEIMESEAEKFDKKLPEIDGKHAIFAQDRTRMLTVKKLIDWLSKQNPNACVLAWEPNSQAYIEQLPDIPSCDICTVAEMKKQTRHNLESWYRHSKDAEQKIQKDMDLMFRYAKDDDIVINFE